ncbi:MAG: adenine phosphoribosyltransferase [Polyangiaceae bacterium]|nr:adenine phosphoribosyltransferase [Polyangiaceae bacterium]
MPRDLAVPRDSIAFAASKVRDIPDFPRPGVTFKDVTPLLASPKAFHIVLDVLAERFIGEQIDTVVGIDARGFIFAGALAARLNAAFVPARKPGRLPHEVDQVTYKSEYAIDTLEMHRDAIVEESRVIIVDDVLATGGTAKAASELVRMQGGYVVAHAFAIELTYHEGRIRLLPTKVESVIRF